VDSLISSISESPVFLGGFVPGGFLGVCFSPRVV